MVFALDIYLNNLFLSVLVRSSDWIVYRIRLGQLNRELKQTDAAAVRRRPTSKSPFKRAQGQVNSFGPWHQLSGDMPVDRLLSAAALSLLKAWSPYSCNSRRTCLRWCFKEDFKAFNIFIATISCETSILVITAAIWRPSRIWIA